MTDTNGKRYISWPYFITTLIVILFGTSSIAWAIFNSHKQSIHQGAITPREFNNLTADVKLLRRDVSEIHGKMFQK